MTSQQELFFWNNSGVLPRFVACIYFAVKNTLYLINASPSNSCDWDSWQWLITNAGRTLELSVLTVSESNRFLCVKLRWKFWINWYPTEKVFYRKLNWMNTMLQYKHDSVLCSELSEYKINWHCSTHTQKKLVILKYHFVDLAQSKKAIFVCKAAPKFQVKLKQTTLALILISNTGHLH